MHPRTVHRMRYSRRKIALSEVDADAPRRTIENSVKPLATGIEDLESKSRIYDERFENS